MQTLEKGFMNEVLPYALMGLALIVFTFLCTKLYLRSFKKMAEGGSSKNKIILMFILFGLFLLAFHFGSRLIIWCFSSMGSK